LIEASAAVTASIRVLLPMDLSYLNCSLSPSIQSMHSQAPSMPTNWFLVDALVATSRNLLLWNATHSRKTLKSPHVALLNLIELRESFALVSWLHI
jgi:hypothetical protein